jgi:hypothetical protein
MGEADVQPKSVRQVLWAENSLPLSSVRVFLIGAGIGFKARRAALFKAAAVLSGMI